MQGCEVWGCFQLLVHKYLWGKVISCRFQQEEKKLRNILVPGSVLRPLKWGGCWSQLRWLSALSLIPSLSSLQLHFTPCHRVLQSDLLETVLETSPQVSGKEYGNANSTITTETPRGSNSGIHWVCFASLRIWALCRFPENWATLKVVLEKCCDFCLWLRHLGGFSTTKEETI